MNIGITFHSYKIAKDNPIKIIIKPHPTIKNCTDQLKENFKNLRFSIIHRSFIKKIVISY